MIIGSLGGMRNTLLSALRVMPVCRVATHILAARMQKAVILGSLRLLRAHDTRTQARRYFSPPNLLTLDNAQIRRSLKYCSHIWRGAVLTNLSILDVEKGDSTYRFPSLNAL
nr:unnamed protein product [Callosobruchus chinensis]